ncbi:MAG: hypothetical protein HOQ22_01295 [Nocardioidaceae bacterium]|nr:hypothetical protein [Nocardioidaceae bacterium]NUS49662.1 hypothetical protein [Nocardioidaceae bacterium]
MRFLLELVPVLLVVGVCYLIWLRTRTTAQERVELANLRAFKERVRDAALTEIEVDSANPLGRIVLDEVRQVDRANSSRTELS